MAAVLTALLQISFADWSNHVLTPTLLKPTKPSPYAIVIPLHTMSHWTAIGILALGCVVVVHTARRAFASRTPYPLPPGPPGLPWIGNVVGIDAGAPWKTYAEWARTFGGLRHLQFYTIYSTSNS